MAEDSSISSLLSLLDDPDENIYAHVRRELLKRPSETETLIEELLENTPEPLVASRCEDLLQEMRKQKGILRVMDWKREGSADLLSGLMILNEMRYPHETRQEIENKIDKIKLDAWLELNYDLTAFEKVKILNHIIFELHGFQGDTENYHHPENSYIGRVLDSKKGNPISLSILYSLVAQRLNIPVYGVNLPQHFIVGYMLDDELQIIKRFNDPSRLEGEGGSEEVYFYINPFNKGAVFNRANVKAYLEQMNIKPDERHLGFCSNIEILKRVLRNLCNAKGNKQDELLKTVYIEMLQVLE